mmetsp:Transcript_107613/g.286400  ORF Transcript_107613/g.286400 Transcript_107613/m.286400 type:complete len:202 (-) Transcript_107613:21-626(-)
MSGTCSGWPVAKDSACSASAPGGVPSRGLPSPPSDADAAAAAAPAAPAAAAAMAASIGGGCSGIPMAGAAESPKPYIMLWQPAEGVGVAGQYLHWSTASPLPHSCGPAVGAVTPCRGGPKAPDPHSATEASADQGVGVWSSHGVGVKSAQALACACACPRLPPRRLRGDPAGGEVRIWIGRVGACVLPPPGIASTVKAGAP